MTAPAAVLAHGGHGNEFHQESETSQATGSVQVDAETIKRLGIKVEPVTRKQLSVGIQTTGQIETLPNQKVEITSPVDGTVVELLVKPGDQVTKGQAVAVITSAELAQLQVESAQKRAEAEADRQQAQADLRLAQQNLQQQRQIATAEIEQAKIELRVSTEQYQRDQELVSAGALPRRQMLESQAHLAEARAEFAKASSRREVLAAEAALKRAQAAVEVAQSRLRLSNAGYQARLQQLGAIANNKGLVTVVAPIAGTVADREITLGESVKAAEKPLMTLLNDSKVFATANIYEKDLNQVKLGQAVSVKVATLRDRTFKGKISVIGSVVEETRVVPVKAELNNAGGLLKPGMFAELEVLTHRTPSAILTIPTSAVVDANGKKLVYIQNGNAFQSVEINLGQTSGDRVEVKSGLFEGDLVVTQRAFQLYAQSLRGDQPAKTGHEAPATVTQPQPSNSSLPGWVLPLGGAIAVSTFWAGTLWASRRTQPRPIPLEFSEKETPQPSLSYSGTSGKPEGDCR